MDNEPEKTDTKAAPIATPHSPPQAPPADGAEPTSAEEKIVAIMRSVFDPEIPVNIYDLGMVYDIKESTPGDITVKMTLTSPACPVAGSLPGEVEAKMKSAAWVTAAKVDLVWEPMWTPERMAEAAKLQLGML